MTVVDHRQPVDDDAADVVARAALHERLDGIAVGADADLLHIERGAVQAGRRLADLDLQAGGTVAFGDDVEDMIARRRPGFAFILGAMGSRQHNFYNDAFRRAGYEDAAREVQRLWLEHRREAAAARVPEELVRKANLLGTEAMVRERVKVYREAGVTTLRVEPEGATLEERLQTLGRRIDLVRETRPC